MNPQMTEEQSDRPRQAEHNPPPPCIQWKPQR